MASFLKKIRKSGRNAIWQLAVPAAIHSLSRQAASVGTVADAVTLAVNFSFLGMRIAPCQIQSEITALLQLLAQRSPRALLELGTRRGGTFFMLSRVAAPDAILISLDLPPGPQGGYDKWKEKLYASFGRERQQVVLIRADSHDKHTVETVRRALNGRMLDFILIDGDHSYEGVKSDYSMYSPLVSEGGIIALHDIVPGPSKRVGGVPQFWQELKQKGRATEFVADWKQGGYGIGVVRIGTA